MEQVPARRINTNMERWSLRIFKGVLYIQSLNPDDELYNIFPDGHGVMNVHFSHAQIFLRVLPIECKRHWCVVDPEIHSVFLQRTRHLSKCFPHWEHTWENYGEFPRPREIAGIYFSTKLTVTTIGVHYMTDPTSHHPAHRLPTHRESAHFNLQHRRMQPRRLRRVQK